jgi:hypothetical protein
MIDSILMNISNNKLFGGCIMLLTNVGGKYLMLEMPNNIDKLFSNYFLLRYLVLFSIFFMATRDIKTSILLSLLFFIIIKFVLNEKSSFCLFNKESDISKKNISIEEYNRAMEFIYKYNQARL